MEHKRYKTNQSFKYLKVVMAEERADFNYDKNVARFWGSEQ